MKPALFIVPGIYEGLQPFNPLKEFLASRGHDHVFITRLPSTGTFSSSDGSCIDMNDDTASIATDLAEFVHECGDREIVMLCHSAGGFLGSSAVKGLTRRERRDGGEKGGVVGMVFLTAGLLPEGVKHKTLPFMKYSDDGSRHTCLDPAELFFNDATASEKNEWIPRMECQPGEEWHRVVEYCGWMDLPSVSIVCDDDRAVPAVVQRHMASMAGSRIVEIEGAGHMAQITRTEEVGEIVDGILNVGF